MIFNLVKKFFGFGATKWSKKSKFDLSLLESTKVPRINLNGLINHKTIFLFPLEYKILRLKCKNMSKMDFQSFFVDFE